MSNIIILDTGAEYILTVDDRHVETAIRLYESIEVSLYKKTLDIIASNDEMKFIYDNIGRVIPCILANQIDILKKLNEDIGMVLGFYKCKTFWKNLSGNVEKNIEADNLEKNIEANNLEQSILPCSKINDLMTINEGLYGSSIMHAPLQLTNFIILYNTIYGISIVAELNCPEEFCKAFPEFILAMTINKSDSEVVKKHFDKISYPTIEELLSTCEAFKKLYGIGNTKKISEKEMIKQFLDSHFDVSNEIDKRIKANDLYKELINYLCISYEQSSSFKKRAAGCLTEIGLQKKRFSDAYYYYGIKKKEYASIDIQQIEDQRDKERKEWFYNPSRQSTNL